MRRLLAWILVTLGIAAVARRLRRREHDDGMKAASDGEPDPAEELRVKLAESRAEEAGSIEADAPVLGVDERRAAVHERGRATLDSMQSQDEG